MKNICLNKKLKLVIYIFSSLFYMIFHKKVNAYKLRNKSSCVVMGNGPSLKKTLLKNFNFIKGKEIICVNEFAHSKYFRKIKPSYYVFADPSYWLQKIPGRFKAQIAKVASIFEKDVTWNMVIFLPQQARKYNLFTKVAEKNKKIIIFYFSTIEARGPKFLKNTMLKLGLVSFPIQNVLVAAIFLALNMNFKKIYLVGADHSWHEDLYMKNDNVLLLKDVHFFDKKKPVLKPFYKNRNEESIFRMNEIFAALARTFNGYILLEEYSQVLKAKIYNASDKSYIDAFERYKIDK